MRIAIGADHAGFTLKEHLKKTLATLGHQVDDHGTHSEASVDYPPICAAVGHAVVEGKAPRHDGEWAMATMEVCLAMLRSAREQREIAL